jgi:hypothetical protein
MLEKLNLLLNSFFFKISLGNSIIITYNFSNIIWSFVSFMLMWSFVELQLQMAHFTHIPDSCSKINSWDHHADFILFYPDFKRTFQSRCFLLFSAWWLYPFRNDIPECSWMFLNVPWTSLKTRTFREVQERVIRQVGRVGGCIVMKENPYKIFDRTIWNVNFRFDLNFLFNKKFLF